MSTKSKLVSKTSSLKRRRAVERLYKLLGFLATGIAIIFLGGFLLNVAFKGYGAFTQTKIALEIKTSPERLKEIAEQSSLADKRPDYSSIVLTVLKDKLKLEGASDLREASYLLSAALSSEFEKVIKSKPISATTFMWFTASDDVNQYVKGNAKSGQGLNDRQVQWVERLKASGAIETKFNWSLFTTPDSQDPELAGLLPALIGSLMTLVIAFAIAFPVGSLAALYLEEFAPKSRWQAWVEINISNLAAIPSIVYGILGLAVYISIVGLPRSSPLVGGLTIGLMILPVIIVTGRVACKNVPKSIRQAALGMGASPLQVAFHFVFPLALPGVLTGTIISMARALGESAPLLVIGMAGLFLAAPHTPLDPSTVLPLQIFSWAKNPELGFVEKTAAAIFILLSFLVIMNLGAIIMRKKLEKRW